MIMIATTLGLDISEGYGIVTHIMKNENKNNTTRENKMKNELTLAIAKGIKAKFVKEASAGLAVGEYTVDSLVRVSGTVKKGEEQEQIVHMKAPQWKIIGVLLSKVNDVTMDSVMREALDMDDAEETKIKERAAAAMDVIKGTTKQPVAGKVTTKLEFEEVVLTTDQEKESVEQKEAVVA